MSSMTHMANGIRTGDPRGFKEGWRTYPPKRRNNSEHEDNSLKTLNDKNHHVLSQKFRHLISQVTLHRTFIFFDLGINFVWINLNLRLVWFGWFYGMSNIVVYSMLNSLYTYLLNILFVSTFDNILKWACT